MKYFLKILFFLMMLVILYIFASLALAGDRGKLLVPAPRVERETNRPGLAQEAIISHFTASTDETDDTPCLTADGTDICPAKENIAAANWLPFGTLIEVDEIQYRIADRMARKNGYPKIDLLVSSKKEAFKKGKETKIIILK
ncbi:MAG: hypothetical protein UV20_C0009G0051 [Candidatus Magasanikbacteria bacterium GW2011_GWA2_42_32]|uniref:3D domain-containing protein n=1 Tax=Candidatus Magasanikbacteria bacterium GW2011_GWA2_42_32 TaxID=1619039 RepID=A0A0G1A661_9BACT|nr:MAG: hypothetical protein UV20_C0009G0051 [Candidatus Magasanikbacteria bacterium GW2011_GWA2_42_32]HBX15873.1 hypothetical protein [Candidatus Magasanikbacteria bacterium]